MRVPVVITALWLAAVTVGCVASHSPASARPSETSPPEACFRLPTVGVVFVPQALPPKTKQLDLVVHFHGDPEVVEREFAAAELRAVLVIVNYRGLSSAYEKPFSDPALFRTLLDETLAGLESRDGAQPDANWRRVCVSSFSAGFGAVRALLKVPAYFERIDALYLADTLYAGYAEQGGQRKVNPDSMKDFRRFAAEAVAGRKTMIITHSYLEPGAYAGTHETADDLIAFVGAKRREVDEPGPGAMRIISRVGRGHFHVYGCAGTTGQDHLAHLRNMRFWYPLLSIELVGHSHTQSLSTSD